MKDLNFMIRFLSTLKSHQRTEPRRKMKYLRKLSTKPTVPCGSQQLLKFVPKTPGMFGFGSSGFTDLTSYPAVVNPITANEKSSNPLSRTLSLPIRSPVTPTLLIGKKWMIPKMQTVLMDCSGGRLLTRIRVNLAYVPPILDPSSWSLC